MNRIMTVVSKLLLCNLVAVAMSYSQTANATLIPVNATFTGGSADGFTFTPSANATIASTSDVARLTLTGVAESTVNLGSLQVTNLGTGAFSGSMQMTFNSYAITQVSGSGGTIGSDWGLIMFAADGIFTTSTLYQLDFNLLTGKIRMTNVDTAGSGGSLAGTTYTSTNSFTYAAGETYTLNVSGNYTGGGTGLNMTFSLFDPNGTGTGDDTTVTISASDNSSPFTGQFFGFRGRTGAVGGVVTTTGQIDVDNFTLIPEPSTYAMIGIGLVGFIHSIRYRRSRKQS